MDKTQKEDIRKVFFDEKGCGEFDYVTGWYKLASEYIKGTNVEVAFVSTNSICQGQQVITFWKHLISQYNIHINFAYRTFVWNSEANDKAKVHCVIVGFGNNSKQKKLLFDEGKYQICDEISPYLTNTPVVFVDSRSTPLCKVSPMRFGSMPRDGGGFILTKEQKEEFILKEPLSQKWIHPYIGAVEFLNNKERYCLWLLNAKAGEILRCPMVLERVEYVRNFRESSKAAGTRKFAETPTVFCQIAQPDSDYIMVPKTSSGKRKYLPLGFQDKNVIASDLVFLIPDATLYEFGVLMSNVHNAWMRIVAGRLKSDYRYSKDIVYNNFPWCVPTEKQKANIERTAQTILDARAKYPESSLANMYGEHMYLYPELLKAHQENDRAVMEAYGFTKIEDGKRTWLNESETVAELFKMYQELTEK